MFRISLVPFALFFILNTNYSEFGKYFSRNVQNFSYVSSFHIKIIDTQRYLKQRRSSLRILSKSKGKDDGNQASKILIGDSEINIARKKKNKYQQFSKAKPYYTEAEEKKILEAKREAEKKKKSTIPIPVNANSKESIHQQKVQASAIAPSSPTNVLTPVETKKAPISSFIEDFNKIDPYDPFTYGFMPIGRIIEAHGLRGEMRVEVNPSLNFTLVPNQKIYILRPGRHVPRPIILQSFRKLSREMYLFQLESIKAKKDVDELRNLELFLTKSEVRQLDEDEYYQRDLIDLYCYSCSANLTLLDPLPFGKIHNVLHPEDYLQNAKNRPDLLAKLHALLEIELLRPKPTDELIHSPEDAIKKLKSKLKKGKRDNDPAEGSQTSQADILTLLNPSNAKKPKIIRQFCTIPFVQAIVKKVDIRNRRILMQLREGLLDFAYQEEFDPPVIKGLLPPAKPKNISETESSGANQNCTSYLSSTKRDEVKIEKTVHLPRENTQTTVVPRETTGQSRKYAQPDKDRQKKKSSHLPSILKKKKRKED